MSLLWVAVALFSAAQEEPENTAPVAGFPETTNYEEDLLKGVRSLTRGRWRVDKRGVTLEAPASFGPNLWFPVLERPIGDGTLRARFDLDPDKRLNTVILIRCQFDPDNLEAFRGYGFALAGEGARFVRYDGESSRYMGPGIKVPLLADHSSLEVVLTQVGPHMTAQLFDGETLRSIGVLSVAARRFMKGQVGLRGGPKIQLRKLSLIRAGSDRVGIPNARTGNRVVRISRRELERAGGKFEAKVAAREGKDVYLRLAPVEFERLLRTGVVPRSVSDQVPWRFIDPLYEVARRPNSSIPDFGYKNPAMVERYLRALHERYPDLTELVSIGTTASGRDIWAFRINSEKNDLVKKPAVLIDGAQHGVELWATEFVIDAARDILENYPEDPRAKAWVEGLDIWLVPLVNPDGRDAFMEVTHLAGRKNYRDVNGDGSVDPREGVDINRNFPFAWGRFGERGSRTTPHHNRFRGNNPASEPESRALMALARRTHFAAAISVHTKGTVILPPYATRGVKQSRQDEAWQIVKKIADGVPRQMNGKRYRLRRRLYPVDGVWKDWLRHELGTLAFVVEGPYHNPLDPSVVEQTIEQSRPIWQLLFDRTVSGPLVAGWVVNPEGEAVAAQVEIAENTPQAGERWLARPTDGFFVRYLVEGGPQTLKVSSPGYETRTFRLSSREPAKQYVIDRSVRAEAP